MIFVMKMKNFVKIFDDVVKIYEDTDGMTPTETFEHVLNMPKSDRAILSSPIFAGLTLSHADDVVRTMLIESAQLVTREKNLGSGFDHEARKKAPNVQNLELILAEYEKVVHAVETSGFDNPRLMNAFVNTTIWMRETVDALKSGTGQMVLELLRVGIKGGTTYKSIKSPALSSIEFQATSYVYITITVVGW